MVDSIIIISNLASICQMVDGGVTLPNEEKENRIENKSSKAGIDLPLDSFTVHHSFIHSSITEYEYSHWYFLFFIFFDKPSKQAANVELVVPEITKSLASKLSVSASVLSVSRVEKYRTKSISTNLTLTNHTIPGLHHKICNLQNTSPLFWMQDTRYKLVQVIHDKNKHLFVREDKQVDKIVCN